MKFFKNILIYSVLTLSVFMLNSCFDDSDADKILTKKFVSFAAQSDIEIMENEETDTLLLEMSYAQNTDVEVTYVVEEDGAIEGIDFEVDAPNPIVIPAGEYSVKLPINVTNNDVYDGADARSFTITITNVSVSGVDIDAVNTATITIGDDDCLLNPADFIGVFNCDEPGYGEFEVTITEGDQENRFVIDNWSDYGAGVDIYVDFDSESNIVTVPDQPTGLVAGGIPVNIVGDGEYSACTGTFSYHYILYNSVTPSTIYADNTHTYTKP